MCQFLFVYYNQSLSSTKNGSNELSLCVKVNGESLAGSGFGVFLDAPVGLDGFTARLWLFAAGLVFTFGFTFGAGDFFGAFVRLDDGGHGAEGFWGLPDGVLVERPLLFAFGFLFKAPVEAAFDGDFDGAASSCSADDIPVWITSEPGCRLRRCRPCCETAGFNFATELSETASAAGASGTSEAPLTFEALRADPLVARIEIADERRGLRPPSERARVSGRFGFSAVFSGVFATVSTLVALTLILISCERPSDPSAWMRVAEILSGVSPRPVRTGAGMS